MEEPAARRARRRGDQGSPGERTGLRSDVQLPASGGGRASRRQRLPASGEIIETSSTAGAPPDAGEVAVGGGGRASRRRQGPAGGVGPIEPAADDVRAAIDEGKSPRAASSTRRRRARSAPRDSPAEGTNSGEATGGGEQSDAEVPTRSAGRARRPMFSRSTAAVGEGGGGASGDGRRKSIFARLRRARSDESAEGAPAGAPASAEQQGVAEPSRRLLLTESTEAGYVVQTDMHAQAEIERELYTDWKRLLAVGALSERSGPAPAPGTTPTPAAAARSVAREQRALLVAGSTGMADEGFFVEQPPNISEQQISLLLARLSADSTAAADDERAEQKGGVREERSKSAPASRRRGRRGLEAREGGGEEKEGEIVRAAEAGEEGAPPAPHPPPRAPALARPALPLPPIHPDPLRPGAGRLYFLDGAAPSASAGAGGAQGEAAGLTRVQPPRAGALSLSAEGARSRTGGLECCVHVQGGVLSDHPLFSAEMVAAARLHAAHATWLQHVTQREAAKLGARITVLRDECEAAEAQLQPAAASGGSRRRAAAEQSAVQAEGGGGSRALQLQQLSSLYAELLQALASRDEAEYEARVLARRALSLWAALKATRSQAKCVTTSLQLRVQAAAADAAEDEAEERRQAAELELHAHRRAHALRAELHAVAAAQSAGSASVAEGAAKEGGSAEGQAAGAQQAVVPPPLPPPPPPFDERAVSAAIEERQSFCLRAPGEPSLSLKLSANDALLTPPEQLSKEERRRQRQLASLAIGGTLRINGHVAGTIPPRAFNPADMRLFFGDVLVVELAQPPRTVALQLLEYRAFSLGAPLIGEVPLPTPADATGGYHSELQPYAFCSATTFVRAPADMPAEPPLANAGTAAAGAGRAGSRARGSAPSAQPGGGGGGGGAGGSAIEPVSATLGSISGLVEVAVDWASSAPAPLAGSRADGAARFGAGGAARGASCASGRAHATSITAGGLLNAAHVYHWLAATALDPNDPRDTPLLRTLRAAEAKLGSSRAFRVTRLEEEATWQHAASAPGADGRVRGSVRTALLRLRSMRPALFSGAVPPRDALVPAEMAALVAPVRADDDEGTAPRADGSDDFVAFSGHRKIALFLKRVQKARAARADKGRAPREVREVVREPADDAAALTCECNAAGLLKLFRPQRKLRPTRRPRMPDYEATDRCLLIGVKRAAGLPTRARGAAGGAGSADELRPFVLFTLGPSRARTTTKSGSCPQWNESLDLALPITAAQLERRQYETAGLTLYCALFDETMRAEGGTDATERAAAERPSGALRSSTRLLAADGRPNAPEGGSDDEDAAAISAIRKAQAARETPGVKVETRRHFLGTLAIPLSTILAEGRVEGTFELSVPPMLLGHTLNADADLDLAQPRGLNGRAQPRAPGARRGALTINAPAPRALGAGAPARAALTLFVTVDPPLPAGPRGKIDVPDLEDSALLSVARKYAAGVGAFPAFATGARPLQLFALNSVGEPTLVCRYVHAQEPPSELRELSELLRFVSLVPFLEDVVTSVEAKEDVWTTTAEFLHIGAGDNEEHALLLCNYLLHRGEEAYVVVGRSALEQTAFYVLSREAGAAEGTLYHAMSGKSYATSDAQCPLCSVGMLFNGTNLWANVQHADTPAAMSWVLSNAMAWRRLFGEANASQEQLGSWTRTVQVSRPTYVRTSEEDKNDLEREVERALRVHIEERRGARPTDWNNNVRRVLKAILVQLETDARQGVTSKPEQLKGELAQTMQSYSMVGFPLNMTWTDIKQVIDALDATDIHNNSGKELKFALAVHVVAYPNSVYSIWVYAAALTSMR